MGRGLIAAILAVACGLAGWSIPASALPPGFMAEGDTIRYSGGPGDSPETAIVINRVPDGKTGVDFEYAFVRERMPGWRVAGQALVEKDGRMYDQLDLADAAGRRQSIYFDITDWFGKGPPN